MGGNTNWLKKVYDLEAEKKRICDELKDAWKVVEDENILQCNGYRLDRREEPVRRIDAPKFRDWFGLKVFAAVAKVGLTDAIKEVGENAFEEGNKTAHFIEYDVRVKKKVIKE